MEQDNILIIKYPHPHFKPQANYSDEIDEEGCVDIAVSPVFFGWLMSLGAKVKVLGPSWVKRELGKTCKKILNYYKS